MPEVIYPPPLSLPNWPVLPELVDATGTSFLIICFGAVDTVAAGWVRQAEVIGPTRLALLETFDRSELTHLLSQCRTGVRIMIVGGQHDVLAALAMARAHGASPSELRSFATSTDDLAFYCAHCRSTYRAITCPAEQVACPGCHQLLEIHSALNSARGSFLASAVHARDLV